jgi:hypothetical protein
MKINKIRLIILPRVLLTKDAGLDLLVDLLDIHWSYIQIIITLLRLL